jgi:hypothetical protein
MIGGTRKREGGVREDSPRWEQINPSAFAYEQDGLRLLANRKAKRLAGLITFYARQSGTRARPPFVGAAVFLHAGNATVRLDPIGKQNVFGPHDNPNGLDSLKDFLLIGPKRPDSRVDERRGREIVDLVKGAKIRPSVKDRRIGQLILHPRPFAEGIGWQDFLAGHAMDTGTVRRVRFYLTSRAPAEDVPVIKHAAEREFPGHKRPDGLLGLRAEEGAADPVDGAKVFDVQ